jgi:predicted glutamine amidotransferase
MCRLLGYAARRPTTTAAVLGGTQSTVFQAMAELHDDGWGSAWVQDGGLRSYRTPTSGFEDPKLEGMLQGEESVARITHLRLATGGLSCTRDNTHPFTADGLAFAHNGSLLPVERIDPFIAPEIAATLTGTTDSERYFAVIRTRLAETGDLVEAVVQAVRQLRPLFPNASLNALLLSPTHLIAVHANESAPIPHGLLDGSGLPEERLPAEHRTAYYLMRQRRLADGTIAFASSGLDVADWAPLPPESVAAVELARGELTVRSLGETAGRREQERVYSE